MPAPAPPCVYERSPGAAGRPLAGGYLRHEPEGTVLHQVVREHLATFLADARRRSDDGAGVPRFVEKELTAFLDCGVLARGFCRVRCEACGDELLIAFSCKRRGVCPSCAARRMHDTALHLVNRVIPHVPMRQWVLAFPWRVRLPLAYDARLLQAALTIFIRALFTFQRRRARALGLETTRAASSASVTFIQRFGSALQLTPHFHTLLCDGIFVHDPRAPDARPRLGPLEPPTDDEVAALLDTVAARVVAMLVRAGRLPDPDAPGADDDSPPDLLAQGLAAVLSAPPRAARGRAPIDLGPAPRSARMDGFSLHANLALHENDREGLLRLCRYGLRPPLAAERLSWDDHGRLRYRMKRTFSDGTRELVLTPRELLGRLAALVPPPRVHLTRYHGAFAAHARGRAALTGTPARICRPAPASPVASLPVASPPSPPPAPATEAPAADLDALAPPPPAAAARPRRLPWAELLRRVHGLDVRRCQRCAGPVRVLAYLTDLPVVAAILRHLGLPSAPPTLARPRGPPEADPEPDGAGWSDDLFVDPPAPD